MKILLKSLVLGCFLLISVNSFSQAEGAKHIPIKLISTSIKVSAVIDYNFKTKTNLLIEIVNSKNKAVKSFKETGIIDATKKYDFYSLPKGKYKVVFKSEEVILLEQQIEKL